MITRRLVVYNLLTHNKLASPRGFEPQFRDTHHGLTAAETNLRQISAVDGDAFGDCSANVIDAV
jgi:hypothetical protein